MQQADLINKPRSDAGSTEKKVNRRGFVTLGGLAAGLVAGVGIASFAPASATEVAKRRSAEDVQNEILRLMPAPPVHRPIADMTDGEIMQQALIKAQWALAACAIYDKAIFG
jgi:hypothetical protein